MISSSNNRITAALRRGQEEEGRELWIMWQKGKTDDNGDDKEEVTIQEMERTRKREVGGGDKK